MKALWAIGLVAALGGVRPVSAADAACGEGRLVCGEDQRCCEHVIARFSGDQPMGRPYVEGQCVPRERECGDFYCGNRHCEPGFFSTPTTCCINMPEDAAPKYSCASSPIACPGNPDALSIRSSGTEVPSRS